jgi:Anti-sigma factor NepR
MWEKPVSNGRRAEKLGHEIKMRMGQQLRAMYGEVMSEGVPDGHQRLLNRLDAGDQAGK